MTSAQPTNVPPGSTGLPGLGETLSFLKDPYGFVRTRVKTHGPVFKRSLFGKKTVVIIGSEAAARFIEPALVERLGSQPAPVFRLFAGPTVPHLDGTAHGERKKLLLRAFTRDALTAYLPKTQALVEESFARWADRPEVRLVDETKRLALAAVAQDIVGIAGADDLARLDAWYADIGAAFAGLPVPIPGTKYTRGLIALGEVLAFFGEVVRAHRAKPTGDGLSRILAFKTPSGVSISDDEAARELHHFVIAGRVVYAHLLTVVMALAKHPEVRQRLQSEVERDLPDGTLSVEKLLAMKYLTQVLMEVKRTSPVVPGMFGRAKADIALGGFMIPRGWTVMFGLRESLVDGSAFVDPDRFDPERFAAPRNEDKRHEHALVPHGPGQPQTSHHCAGTDYASQLTKIFMVTLVRRYRMELPEQRLDYEWSQLTPDPKDGLRARVVKV
ncbi:MAG: cytochrome P450 [Myxococcota bacterium]|nr:cytochrome P450 [Myxococcota bacterium]